ncbi:MAG: aminopeptidase N [Alphaproteobacteria bacterium]
MSTPTATRRLDYRVPAHLVDTIALDFNLAPTKTQVRARLTIKPNRQAAPGQSLVLDGEKLTLVSLKIDGVDLAAHAYKINDTSLTIIAPPAHPFVLETQITIDPQANTALSGLYLSDAIYCTQCEAQGFRRITYFPDRPDVLSVYTVRIEADKTLVPVLLSNGNPVEAGDISRTGEHPGTDRHYAVWHDPFPKPSYLFALVGGDLGVVSEPFTTASGRDVDLKIFVDPGNEARAAFAMEALKASMRWDEQVFGREYDLDVFMIVAVSAFNLGAMENKGLNIFNDRFVLASPNSATDQDYAKIEAIIAHEYFHNWTGNRITCRDWFQLCLKEGLTVFRDQEFTADRRSRVVKRIEDVRILRARQFAEDAGPLAHPVRSDEYLEINNFYTPTIYEKGAEVIRMARTLIGHDMFARAMDAYFDKHDGRAATLEDLIACFAQASGRDFGQFMVWYAQAGTPTLSVTSDYDTAAKRLTVTVTQATAPTPGQPEKTPLHMPFALGLIGSDGGQIALVSLDNQPIGDVLELTQSTHSFHFADVPSRPVLSLNRNFAAPVNLETSQSLSDLLVLMAHDTDPFNRWQAGQNAATKLIVARMNAKAPDPAEFIGALAVILGDEGLEPAYRAELATLPSEAELARTIAHDIDPQAIHDARQWLLVAAGTALATPLRALCQRHRTTGGYSPDAASAGGRALAHAALALLAAGSAKAGPMVLDAYEDATNMADMISALTILKDIDAPERQTGLQTFYERFASDPLVVDKWFGLHAASPLAGTLETVIGLTGHKGFSYTKPNRVRSLIGIFAANQLRFNAGDGAGYAFLADTVLKLDTINPQVAAGLLGALKKWRMLEPGRRAQARASLERVAGHGNLSRNVYEIATKSLQ